MNFFTALASAGHVAQIVMAGGMCFLAYQVWRIKTNDLPHIREDLAKLQPKGD